MAAGLLSGSTQQAHADTLGEYLANVFSIRVASWWGDYTDQEEDALIRYAHQRYLDQHGHAGVGLVGQATVSGEYPVDFVEPGDVGTFAFVWVDSLTGLPTDEGPTIASVMYEANLDPFQPDDWQVLGTSYESDSNFSLDWPTNGFEPMIRATPLDELNKPIVINGLDGYNVARGFVTVIPEPSALVLLALGSVAILRRPGLRN